MRVHPVHRRLLQSWFWPWRVSLLAAFALTVGGAGPAVAQDAAHGDGAHVFMQAHCFVCHGEMGNGGAGPGFRDDRFLGITDYVVAQILIGRGIMPSFADKLSDRQIAAVATYIRTSWGNNFGEVKPEQVAQARKQIKGEEARMGSSQPPRGQTPNPPPKSQK